MSLCFCPVFGFLEKIYYVRDLGCEELLRNSYNLTNYRLPTIILVSSTKNNTYYVQILRWCTSISDAAENKWEKTTLWFKRQSRWRLSVYCSYSNYICCRYDSERNFNGRYHGSRNSSRSPRLNSQMVLHS